MGTRFSNTGHRSCRDWLRAAMLVASGVFLAGCSEAPVEKPASHEGHSTNRSHDVEQDSSHKHGHGAHGEHGKSAHENMAPVRKLVVRTEPTAVQAGSPTRLSLQIHDLDDKPIREFEIVHEKLVHLIVVREGLDEFAHEHPDVDASGLLTQEITFPKSGKYRLFADHQPRGKPAGVAAGELIVEGEVEPLPPLIPDAPAEFNADDLKVRIDLHPEEHETTVRFRFTDANGRVVTDLEPYLGAMGHLVIISADGRDYVHAHPLGEAMTAPEGTVEFAAHFPRPGIYKAWGQFQRNGAVFTVPFVIEHNPSAPSKGAE